MTDEDHELSAHRLRPSDFPAALAAIPDAPRALRGVGHFDGLATPMLAIVGARKCTAFAREFAFGLAEQLVGVGITIVSGLAYGVDAAAHAGALAGGGRTIAVLGGGLGRIYPAAHRGLARSIVESRGLLLSEYDDDAPARKHQFPARNRLISGLSQGVVVVEAAAASGSLITARMALEQGREVMAVPGRANDPRVAGSHRLLREGAALVETLADIEAALEWRFVSRTQAPSNGTANDVDTAAARRLDPAAAKVLDHLSGDAATVDALVQATSLDPEAVLVALTNLELDGFVAASGAGYIRRPFLR